MSEDKNQPSGTTQVDTTTDKKAQYWMERFNCTREDLERAVNAVGSSVEKVEEYIRGNKTDKAA
ncbi:MAG: DUF3606 domain-containing protein [Bacteroidota bacterium]